jgi:hypothetical protein
MDMIDISTTTSYTYIWSHTKKEKNKQIPILLYGCGIVVLILGLMTITFH